MTMDAIRIIYLVQIVQVLTITLCLTVIVLSRSWFLLIDSVAFHLYICRKNWLSSWAVLQGSSLLFTKTQGSSTSWVSVSLWKCT
jgi:hypothetical protein